LSLSSFPMPGLAALERELVAGPGAGRLFAECTARFSLSGFPALVTELVVELTADWLFAERAAPSPLSGFPALEMLGVELAAGRLFMGPALGVPDVFAARRPAKRWKPGTAVARALPARRRYARRRLQGRVARSLSRERASSAGGARA
jgi:hypothetical protein